MEIVITHTDFRLYWPARLRNLNEYLSARGHRLHIIEIAGGGSPYAFEKRSGKYSFDNWSCLFPERMMEKISIQEIRPALLKLLDDIHPDIVLAGAIAFPSGALAVRWCKKNKKLVIIFDNARLQDVPRSWLVNTVKRSIYRNVDAVISPAPSQAGSFEYWGVDSEQIFFGLNVVDNDFFLKRRVTGPGDLQILRDQLELPDTFLLGVGRLVKKKNWVELIRCFASEGLKRSGGSWSLVIVGDGQEKNRILSLCEENSIHNVILRDFVSQEELCKYYSLANGLVLPSLFGETWGLVVNEAMASGLPVLVSDQCGCADSLVHTGKNGFLFSPSNSASIIAALGKFFTLSDSEREEMGGESLRIIDNWGLERFAEAAWQAIQYCSEREPLQPCISDSVIINSWNGRYRPT